jgi:hypothetical protein
MELADRRLKSRCLSGGTGGRTMHDVHSETSGHLKVGITFASDEKYFPLAKGLVLSLTESAPLPAGMTLLFIDIGCSNASLEWMDRAGARIVRPDTAVMGRFGDPRLSYRRGQLCRPFLPELIADLDVFIWFDVDIWVQDLRLLDYLRNLAAANPEKLVACPESHYSYRFLNEQLSNRRKEIYSYYEPIFGDEIASAMCERAVLNSGLFAMSRHSPIWREWAASLSRLNQEAAIADLHRIGPRGAIHMVDQTALNYVASKGDRVVLLDPIYNYLCLFAPPFRDNAGVVRLPDAPFAPLGGIHLAGGAGYLKGFYDRGLFYRGGDFMTAADLETLFGEVVAAEAV